jgi:nucleotide-binding universal stress UspA family protein
VAQASRLWKPLAPSPQVFRELILAQGPVRRKRAIFEKVVMATDFSAAWDEIVSCGGELSHLGCSSVILTHVITPNFFRLSPEELRQQAEPRLAQQRRQLEDQGLQVRVEILVGLPGSSLNEVARKHDASLVVIGSHGKSRWREGVLGSFASAVCHNIQFPTLMLPVRVSASGQPAACLWRCTDLLGHLLLPTDFSQPAAQALVYVELLVPRGVARVTLVHAWQVPPLEFYEPGLPERVEAAARNSLEILEHRLEAAGVPRVDSRLIPGHPISVILEMLQAADVSLIVLGTQGRGFVAEIFLGSVAHNITRVAPCPILLIPPMNREGAG